MNSKAFTETQAIRNRKLARETAERQARYLALLFVIEIFGFLSTIIIELLK